jgi:hypothetical protein
MTRPMIPLQLSLLLLLLAVLARPIDSFHPWTECRPARRSSWETTNGGGAGGRCWMGGYYSEPEDDNTRSSWEVVDGRPKHRVFGKECVVEDIVTLPGIAPLQVLVPVSSTPSLDQQQPPDSTMLIHLAEQLVQQVDMTSISTLLELGSSVVSLVAARKGVKSVLACDIDGGSLRLLEHSARFINSPPVDGIQTGTAQHSLGVLLLCPCQFFVSPRCMMLIQEVALYVSCLSRSFSRPQKISRIDIGFFFFWLSSRNQDRLGSCHCHH